MATKQDTLEPIRRYIDKIYPSPEALEDFISKKGVLKIYLGIDATGPHIHFGHATNLLVLKYLQEKGIKVIIMIGDFTGRVGDPTDKLSARQQLSEKEAKINYKTFAKQAGRIIRFSGKNAATLRRNSQWLKKMTFSDVIELTQHVTVQQMIERDMFQERLKTQKPIYLHEFLYPIMQGYDSVALDVNAEIGGTDQTFNMLVGRQLLKDYKHRDKFVITTKLLVNPETGKKLMNKSEGETINLDDSPEEMFGKVMALSDEGMFPLATLSTRMSLARIAELKQQVDAQSLNPRDAKLEIASAIVETIYGSGAAQKAQKIFIETFSKKNVEESALTLIVKEKNISPTELIIKSGVAKSNGEARRLIEQGGFKVNDKAETDPHVHLVLKKGTIIKIGKRHFFKIG